MRKTRLTRLIPALALIGAGCATKAYVQQTVSQSQTRLNASIDQQGQRVDDQARRVGEQASRVDAQGKQVEGVTGRVGKVETSVDEVKGVARSAATKADEASARAEEAHRRASRLLTSHYKRKPVETIQVYFGVDRADLNDAAQTGLTGVVREMTENRELVADLEGYADSRGSARHNLQLSERRVAAVRRFLAEHGIELPRINWIGMGAVPDRSSRGDRAKNRRVTVRLLLPDDGMTASPTPAKPVAETLSADRPAPEKPSPDMPPAGDKSASE